MLDIFGGFWLRKVKNGRVINRGVPGYHLQYKGGQAVTGPTKVPLRVLANRLASTRVCEPGGQSFTNELKIAPKQNK